MERIIDFVTTVLNSVSFWSRRQYYKFTAYIPRQLPRTEAEFEHLRLLMIRYYGLDEDPTAWYTACSQITSLEATKLRKSYGRIVNAAKRLKINALAQEQKQKCIQIQNEKLKATVEVVASEVSDVSSEDKPQERTW